MAWLTLGAHSHYTSIPYPSMLEPQSLWVPRKHGTLFWPQHGREWCAPTRAQETAIDMTYVGCKHSCQQLPTCINKQAIWECEMAVSEPNKPAKLQSCSLCYSPLRWDRDSPCALCVNKDASWWQIGGQACLAQCSVSAGQQGLRRGTIKFLHSKTQTGQVLTLQ